MAADDLHPIGLPTSGYPAAYEPETDFSAMPFNKANIDPELDSLATILTHYREIVRRLIRDDWQLNDGQVSKRVLTQDLQDVLTRLQAYDASATALTAAQAAAAASAAAASLSAVAAAAAADTVDDTFLGVKATDPALDNDGNPLRDGAFYLSTATNAFRFYVGGAWMTPAQISETLRGQLAAASGAGLVGFGATTVATALNSLLNNTNAANLLGVTAGGLSTNVGAALRGLALPIPGWIADCVQGVYQSATQGNNVLTVNGYTFTAADIGKAVVVTAAGASGGPLNTTISGISNGNAVLANNFATTVPQSATSKDRRVNFGTDNTMVLLAALSVVPTRAWTVPDGRGLVAGTVTTPNDVQLFGTNKSVVVTDNAWLTAGTFGSGIASRVSGPRMEQASTPWTILRIVPRFYALTITTTTGVTATTVSTPNAALVKVGDYITARSVQTNSVVTSVNIGANTFTISEPAFFAGTVTDAVGLEVIINTGDAAFATLARDDSEGRYQPNTNDTELVPSTGKRLYDSLTTQQQNQQIGPIVNLKGAGSKIDGITGNGVSLIMSGEDNQTFENNNTLGGWNWASNAFVRLGGGRGKNCKHINCTSIGHAFGGTLAMAIDGYVRQGNRAYNVGESGTKLYQGYGTDGTLLNVTGVLSTDNVSRYCWQGGHDDGAIYLAVPQDGFHGNVSIGDKSEFCGVGGSGFTAQGWTIKAHVTFGNGGPGFSSVGDNCNIEVYARENNVKQLAAGTGLAAGVYIMGDSVDAHVIALQDTTRGGTQAGGGFYLAQFGEGARKISMRLRGDCRDRVSSTTASVLFGAGSKPSRFGFRANGTQDSPPNPYVIAQLTAQADFTQGTSTVLALDSSLSDPNGWYAAQNGGTLPLITLPVAGTYEIEINGTATNSGGAAGSFNFILLEEAGTGNLFRADVNTASISSGGLQKFSAKDTVVANGGFAFRPRLNVNNPSATIRLGQYKPTTVKITRVADPVY